MTGVRGFGEITRVWRGHYEARYQGPDARFYDSAIVFPGKIYAKGWLIGEKRLIDAGTWTPPTSRPLRHWKEAKSLDPAKPAPVVPLNDGNGRTHPPPVGALISGVGGDPADTAIPSRRSPSSAATEGLGGAGGLYRPAADPLPDG